MTRTADRPMDPITTDHVDVLIVGAGLSGIGAACHLQSEAPGVSYEILEARGASGGTWDLFRYPGVRSDSDMFTLGYPFRPWKRPEAIADGGEILRYLRETAAEHKVDDHVTYHSRVVQADWSAQDARWTVTIERTGGRAGESTDNERAANEKGGNEKGDENTRGVGGGGAGERAGLGSNIDEPAVERGGGRANERLSEHEREGEGEGEGEKPESIKRITRTCGFLYLCSGYYRYDQGYAPSWPGREEFKGEVIHPQEWPDGLDVSGKNVVVIGSGATAVTLVPALADAGAHVTMLQRSPSYIMSLPAHDPIAAVLRTVLPADRAYEAIRWKNARVSTALYALCRKYPNRMRALLRKGVVKRLPDGYDVDKHFTPEYNPWDQRLCLVPGGDFFTAITDRKAEIVTDHITAFTATGLRLRSGDTLDADIIVTATGLNLLPLGGIDLSIGGEPVALPERVAYKGVMLDAVPNLAFALGYTNASWTLKVDLVCSYVARLLDHMRHHGYAIVTPHLPATPMATAPLIEMTSGYFQRSRDAMPLHGEQAPWRLKQHYFKDATLFRGPIDAPELEFSPATRASRATQVARTAASGDRDQAPSVAWTGAP